MSGPEGFSYGNSRDYLLARLERDAEVRAEHDREAVTPRRRQPDNVNLPPDTRHVTAPVENPAAVRVSPVTRHACRCEGCAALLPPLAPVWHRRVTVAPARYHWLTLCATCETSERFARARATSTRSWPEPA